MFVRCSSDEIGLFVYNSDFVFIFARFHRMESRSSLFLPNPLWPNAVEHKNRVGKWKKRGTVDQKSCCFLGIVRVKVPLVGDRIERSEDFPFVPYTRAYTSAVIRFLRSPLHLPAVSCRCSLR